MLVNNELFDVICYLLVYLVSYVHLHIYNINNIPSLQEGRSYKTVQRAGRILGPCSLPATATLFKFEPRWEGNRTHAHTLY